MQNLTDAELLAEYAARQSEGAFAQIVERYAALVYSAAFRQVGDAHLAEEIAQAVFIILARKAGNLAGRTVLAGWMCRTAHFAARDALKMERRRQHREQFAAIGQTETGTEAAWQQLAPLLDEAIAQLGEADRNALALRFYEQRPLEEVGAALGIGADAAQKRVSRALEKLRALFAKRGVTLSVTMIAGAVAANSVQAVPATLIKTISAVAVAKGAAAGASTLAVVTSTLKALAWTKYRTLIIASAAVLITGTAIVVTVPKRPEIAPPQIANQTNTVPAVREPLANGIMVTLDSPPGGLAIQPDGKIVVGTTLFGEFLDTNSGVLGHFSRGALRLNRDGSLDRTFLCDVGHSDSAAAQARVEINPDGKMLISGIFGFVDGQPRPNYAVLQPDGKLDDSFLPWRGNTNVPGFTGLPAGVSKTAWLPDNSIAIMSESLEGPRMPYPPTVYRLDETGRWIKPKTDVLEGTFARPSGLIATLGPVGFWARQAIDWTNDAPAQPRPPVRYGSDILDIPHSPPVSDLPFDGWTQTPVAAHGAIVLKSLFDEVPMEMCRYAVRLPDGGAMLAVRNAVNNGSMIGPGGFMRFDRNWKPDFSFTNSYEADLRSELRIKRQKDGKLLIGGLVGKMDGEDFPGLLRLNEDGAVDRSFRCTTTTNSLDGRVMDIAIQDDGKIVICGFFSTVNHVEVPHIARLNSDGSLDPSFKLPFMSLEQFNRDRFSPTRRVPVVKLTRPATGTNAPVSLPQTILITSMRLEDGAAVVQYTGSPRQRYILQAKDALDQAEWFNVSTNQSGRNGNGTFRDVDADKFPTRFYRIATP